MLTFEKVLEIKHTVTQVNVDGKNITVQKDRTKTKSSTGHCLWSRHLKNCCGA